MSRRKPAFLLAAAIALSAAALRANHSPVSSDNTITGLPAPADNSPVEVTHENLTITIAPESATKPSDRPGGFDGLATSPIHVTAEYRLKNPTDKPVDLPLAFPIFNADPVTTKGFRVTQDNKTPLAATVDDPFVTAQQKEYASQKDWLKRLDAWMLERPAIAAALAKLRATPPANDDARSVLRAALTAHGIDNYQVLNLLSGDATPADQLAAVVQLIDRADPKYAVESSKGQPISILNDVPSRYEPYREAWTKTVLAWLNSMDDVAKALPAYRAAMAREKEVQTITLQLEKSAQTPWAPTIVELYRTRAPGDPIPDPAPVKPDELPQQRIFVPTELAAALFPDVAKDQADQQAAARKLAAQWGADPRLLSVFTGKLYVPTDRGTQRSEIAGLLSDTDAPILPPNLDNIFAALPTLQTYTVHLDAHAETALTVDYDAHTAFDQDTYSGMSHAIIEQFSYVLDTVQYWKSFGPIDLVISTPTDCHLVISPDIAPSKAVRNRIEYSGTLDKITGNLHIAIVPFDHSGDSLYDEIPPTDESIQHLQSLLTKVTNKEAHLALRFALIRTLTRMHHNYDAWEQVKIARIEAADTTLVDANIRGFTFNEKPSVAQQAWEFIEAKAKSPRILIDSANQYDVTKNELRRFVVESGNPDWPTLLPDDLAHLATRVATWDASKGTTEEQLSADFIFARAGIDREKNLHALIDLATAHDDAAAYAMQLIKALPGDKGAALPLILKHLPTPPGNQPFTADVQAAIDLLSALDGEPVKLAQLAAKSDDFWTRLACLRALRDMKSVPAEAITAVQSLDDSALKDEEHHRLQLEIFALNDKEGYAALRDIVTSKSDWSMRAGQHLAEHGDFAALDRAIEVYNTAPFNQDIWAQDRLEFNAATQIIALAKTPGLFKRLTYRAEFPVQQKEAILQHLSGHPDPDAWPFIEAFYNQHAKGQVNLQMGWFASLLGESGDGRAEAMLREMAPHGNMEFSCAHALGDLLFAKK